MPVTPTKLQAIATAEAAKLSNMSLHTGDPGTTGANEATGGGYARKTVVATATGGVITGAEVTFDIPASTNHTHFGFWEGATFYGGNPLSATVNVTPAGQAKVTGTLPITAT